VQQQNTLVDCNEKEIEIMIKELLRFEKDTTGKFKSKDTVAEKSVFQAIAH
jgi:hypothetical protein